MENYPVQIRKSVELLQQMRSNSEDMAIWKNHPLALEVLSLLDELPCRSGEHTPYDIIFLLGILLENISISDTPRLAIRVLEKQAGLFDDVTEDDMKDYDDRLEPGDIQAELEKWKAYIDTDNVTDGQWRKKYRQYLKADPIERTREWEDIYYDIEMETDRETDPDFPRGMGFCFMYWSAKKAVLARRGIRWRSPNEMNPDVIFD